MSLVEKTTIRSEFLLKLIGQFQGKPDIQEILGALLDQVQDIEVAAFQVLEQTILAAAVGAQLDVIGRIVGEARQGRVDVDYKIGLSARILLNLSSGTLAEIVNIVEVMIGAGKQINVTEDFPAAFDVTVDDIISNGAEVGAFVVLAKPAAVLATFRFFEAVPEFRFDSGSQGLDLGLLGDSVASS